MKHIKQFIRKTASQGFKTLAGGMLSMVLTLNTSAALTSQKSLTMNGIETFISQSSLTADYNPQPKINKLVVTITAYSSTESQTDDSPFITASNKLVKDGIVAANFLPFGTHIQIPRLFGNKIFIVEDRMHNRFSDRVDIWFPDMESALKFGKRTTEIVIL